MSLHTPVSKMVEGKLTLSKNCFYCDSAIKFNANEKRWSSTSGSICKEAK